MIKNTDLFYSKAKEYQDKRKDIVNEYEARLRALDAAKGSVYYDDESEKARDKKDEALKALKKEYAGHFNASFEAMAKANANRKMTPPTEEELRLLQLLKLREKPTEAELTAAANTLKGNTTCLSVLTEIAHNAGYMRGYTNYTEAKEMSVDEADKIIKGLASSVRDFMDYDTPRAARIARAHQERQYGALPNAPALPKRHLFEDKAGCFSEVCGLSTEALAAFENAVND